MVHIDIICYGMHISRTLTKVHKYLLQIVEMLGLDICEGEKIIFNCHCETFLIVV